MKFLPSFLDVYSRETCSGVSKCRLFIQAMHSFRIEYHLLVFVGSLKIAQPGDDPLLGVWHILTGYYSVSSNPKNTQQQQTNKQTKNGIDSNIITDNYTGLNGLSLKPGFHSLTQVLWTKKDPWN